MECPNCNGDLLEITPYQKEEREWYCTTCAAIVEAARDDGQPKDKPPKPNRAFDMVGRELDQMRACEESKAFPGWMLIDAKFDHESHGREEVTFTFLRVRL